MAENSNIEWCDHTWNPWIGCEQISPACKNCYAKFSSPANVSRAKGVELWGPSGQRLITSDENWKKPIRWNKFLTCLTCGLMTAIGSESCRHCGGTSLRRPRVFCASLADVFEDKDELIDARHRMMLLTESTPNLDWLLLTKRPQNVLDMVPVAWWNKWPSNVWIGTTVENQEEADRRIPELLKIPASVRFLSCEPLLGPINLDRNLPSQRILRWHRPMTMGIHWVIVGGESGSDARPMHPDWARSLRNQCQAANIPFTFKQWGQWKPISETTEAEREALYAPNVKAHPQDSHWQQSIYNELYGHRCKVDTMGLSYTGETGNRAYWMDSPAQPPGYLFYKVGKEKAGRTLDGKVWDESPHS